jgi:hypothetical protein
MIEIAGTSPAMTMESLAQEHRLAEPQFFPLNRQATKLK